MIGAAAGNQMRSRQVLQTAWMAFLALQVSLALIVERRLPGLRDPEYGGKLARLQARLAEEPGKPLMLALGSSRAGCGLRPDVIAATTSYRGDTPQVFNFAIAGAGPLIELLILDRLLGQGIVPRCIIIEVMPMLLHQREPWAEASRFPIQRITASDLAILRRVWSDPWRHEWEWWSTNLVPWQAHRFGILNRIEPRWLGWDVRQDHWNRLDALGWLPDPRASVSVADYERGVLSARREYAPCAEGYCITPLATRPLEDLLDICRVNGIEVILLTMPEGRPFRAAYTSAALGTIDRFLHNLSDSRGLRWIDARDWLSDDAFSDGHHLLPGGATEFSRRLASELSEPGPFRGAAGGPGQ